MPTVVDVSKRNSAPVFLWGSATSAYQIEGENIWSDWSEWENKTNHEKCGLAVDHYQLFKQDFILAKESGHNSHRLSIEWSRLEPECNKFSETAVRHYVEVLQFMRSLGLTVCLTLNHFTLPNWLAKLGGWENPKSIDYFIRYVGLVVRELGVGVDLWITINEPLVLATEAYWYGHWPPQIKSHRRMVKVMKNLAAAHQAAYKLIHNSFSQARVGLAHNFFSLEPYRSWFILDRLACRQADKFWNEWVMSLSSGYHDFLGVNYYFHQRVFLSVNYRKGFISFADPKKMNLEISNLGWEINPSGLEHLLLSLWQRYQLPIYVTENGLAANDDQQQINFISRSVNALISAINQGVMIRGYFYWSLLDNFEWDKGFSPKFGLVAVDRKTQQRQPKPALGFYKEICQRGNLETALVSKFGSGVHL